MKPSLCSITLLCEQVIKQDCSLSASLPIGALAVTAYLCLNERHTHWHSESSLAEAFIGHVVEPIP